MEYHIHSMWLSGSQYPSYCTINRFRSKCMEDCVNHLFVQVVMLLIEIGQLSLDIQYIDGTKIESVAINTLLSGVKAPRRTKRNSRTKICAILSLIDDGIAQDNKREDAETCVPVNASILQQFIDKLNEENIRLSPSTQKEKKELKKKEKQVHTLQNCRQNLLEYDEKLAILGDKNSYSKTDKSATFMRMKD